MPEYNSNNKIDFHFEGQSENENNGLRLITPNIQALVSHSEPTEEQQFGPEINLFLGNDRLITRSQ